MNSIWFLSKLKKIMKKRYKLGPGPKIVQMGKWANGRGRARPLLPVQYSQFSLSTAVQ